MPSMSSASRWEELRACLRPLDSWEAWVKRSGEEPPDFDLLPSVPGLPDPLAFAGRRVSTAGAWPAQRLPILSAFRRWVFGAWPEPPTNLEGRLLERREEDGAVIQELELAFGPGHAARLRFELATPLSGGPFPVFMTQRSHAGWARIALARGYATAVYSGCDGHDDTEAFQAVWPEHDWSRLCRRAWGAGRVLDYLHRLPEIERRHAAIAGHSRNGKLALLCGAQDERFGAVISSSSGVGGASPYRLANEAHFSEGIEVITCHFPEWFHPRLRFFAGREDRLPVDANLLLALSAPRAVLVATALNDGCESLSANEAAVRSAAAVWDLFGPAAAGKLRLLPRSGEHDTCAESGEAYVDWCDAAFGRPGPAAARFQAEPPAWHFPYRYAAWKERSGGQTAERPALSAQRTAVSGLADWEAGRADRERRLRWLLGAEPPRAAQPRNETRYGVERAYRGLLLNRPPAGPEHGVERHEVCFGPYVQGQLYAPAGAHERAEREARRLPAAVWLHPESVPSGHPGAYYVGRRMPAELAARGFATLGYDQIGNGYRIEEGRRFYDRYPAWSLLGKMVQDCRAAVDAALAWPGTDPERVFLVGFGLGGTVALLAGALDRRVAGVASVCGFTPWRTESAAGQTGALGRLALWDGGGLLPRLGLASEGPGGRNEIPIDFDEILAGLAPRHLLCMTPVLDREADLEACQVALDAAARIYALHDAAGKLWRDAPLNHRRFTPEVRQRLWPALDQAAGIAPGGREDRASGQA